VVLRIAIVGAGTVGTDLLRRLADRPELEVVLVADRERAAPGLSLASASGIPASAGGFESILAEDPPPEVVFVAADAAARRAIGSRFSDAGIRVVDLTPAGEGVVVIPSVNLDAADEAAEISLATPAAQAAVPFVAAIGEEAPVVYAEVVSTVASAALGAGLRRSVDDVIHTTTAALCRPGRAAAGKAIALVTPAEPPPAMRISVFCLVAPESDRAAIAEAVASATSSLSARVAGCRLAAGPLFEEIDGEQLRTSIVIEAAAGVGSPLLAHAGHLELLTIAATDVGLRLARGPVTIP
jgi:acetaldehyde dehydrogenase